MQGAGAGAASLGPFAGRARTGWAKNVFVQGAPIELTYWHGWTEQWEDMVKFVVDQFHQKQSRITVKPVVVPVGSAQQSAEFMAKLTAAIASGSAHA